MAGFGKAKSSGVEDGREGWEWIQAQSSCGCIMQKCFRICTIDDHVAVSEELPVLGLEVGLKPEDSMNAGGNQTERRSFSKQAEIHEQASEDPPITTC